MTDDRGPSYQSLHWDSEGCARLPPGPYLLTALILLRPAPSRPPPLRHPLADPLRALARTLHTALRTRPPEVSEEEVVEEVSSSPPARAYRQLLVSTPTDPLWQLGQLSPTTLPDLWLTRVRLLLRQHGLQRPALSPPPESWTLTLSSEGTPVDTFHPASLRVVQELSGVGARVIPMIGWVGISSLECQWSGPDPLPELGALWTRVTVPLPRRALLRQTQPLTLHRALTTYTITHPLEWLYIPVPEGTEIRVTVDGRPLETPESLVLRHRDGLTAPGWWWSWALTPEGAHPSGWWARRGSQLQIAVEGEATPLTAYFRVWRWASWGPDDLYRPQALSA